MRVIPVLDLMKGRAVWARGGIRGAYAPVQSVLLPQVGDAVALAGVFHRTLGCEECYVADLDAIMGAQPQLELVRLLAAVGSQLVIDGAASPAQAANILDAGASRVIVGLETLPSFEVLAAIVQAHGRERVVFSLDLRAGRPVSPGPQEPLALVREAVRTGVAASSCWTSPGWGRGKGWISRSAPRFGERTRISSCSSGEALRRHTISPVPRRRDTTAPWWPARCMTAGSMLRA